MMADTTTAKPPKSPSIPRSPSSSRPSSLQTTLPPTSLTTRPPSPSAARSPSAILPPNAQQSSTPNAPYTVTPIQTALPTNSLTTRPPSPSSTSARPPLAIAVQTALPTNSLTTRPPSPSSSTSARPPLAIPQNAQPATRPPSPNASTHPSAVTPIQIALPTTSLTTRPPSPQAPPSISSSTRPPLVTSLLVPQSHYAGPTSPAATKPPTPHSFRPLTPSSNSSPRPDVNSLFNNDVDLRISLENEIHELRRKLEFYEHSDSDSHSHAYASASEVEEDLRRELEQVKRSKKEEIWKFNVEVSKLEKIIEETQIKHSNQIQRLDLLLLFETNLAKEATRKYEELKEDFEKQLAHHKSKAHDANLELARMQQSSNPDEEAKFLREKLQSTELYCLEIEEQVEKMKLAKDEWETKLNTVVAELREATANEHEMLMLLEEMQKEKAAAQESYNREKSLRTSAEEKILIMQKQNDFLTRELRKVASSPPTTPPLPRASSTASPASIAASIPRVPTPPMKFSRNLRLDFEWKTSSRDWKELAVTCVVCSGDGRFLRELSNSSNTLSEFPAVQFTASSQGQAHEVNTQRVELSIDKLGTGELLLFVAKKLDQSTFHDVLSLKCNLIGYDNKEIASFPTTNTSGNHQSIIIGAITSHAACSSFCCPNVVLDGTWKFYWLSLKHNIVSNDQLLSLLRQQTASAPFTPRSLSFDKSDFVDPFVLSLDEFKREIADAREKVAQQWVREDYSMDGKDDLLSLHRGDTVDIKSSALRLSWKMSPPFSGKIQSSCLIFDAFGRLIGDNNNIQNNFGGGEGAIRYESPRVGRQETLIEFKHLPEHCGSMVLVMDTSFAGDDTSREILCRMSVGESEDTVGVWKIDMEDLIRNSQKPNQPNRATAMFLISAVGDQSGVKDWKLSVVGQVLGGNIPLDGMVGYLESQLLQNKHTWESQALIADCRSSFKGLLRNVIGEEEDEQLSPKRESPQVIEREEEMPRLFPSLSSPALLPDAPTKPAPASDLQMRVAYEKAKRKLLKTEKRSLKETLAREREKSAEMEKELRNLRSQLFSVSPPPIVATAPMQQPEPDYVPSSTLRRVKSQDPKEEGRLDAHSESLRKAKSYRKASSSANLVVPVPLSSSASRSQVTSPSSNTYSHNFQLKRTRALSPVVEPRKPHKQPETPPHPPEPVGSEIDDYLHEILERKQISGNIRKLEEGYFLIGTKRLSMQILSGQLVVRVGGGFMNFEEWIRRFGRREGIIIGGDSHSHPNNTPSTPLT